MTPYREINSIMVYLQRIDDRIKKLDEKVDDLVSSIEKETKPGRKGVRGFGYLSDSRDMDEDK